MSAGTAIDFTIKARRQEYEFFYRLGSDMVSAGTVPTQAFVPLFTGVHLGLFAQGADGRPSLSMAYFEYASCVGLDG